jgi:hypothetical protein
MSSDFAKSIIEQLAEIQNDSASYFASAIEAFTTVDGKPIHWNVDYWAKLPQPLKQQSNEIASRLAAVAHLTGPGIRRSPLLTEADAREAGHAFKGLRAALKFRQFQQANAEILHDEGLVLGMRPASEYEALVEPHEAETIFISWMDALRQRLELADPNPASAPDVNLTPAKLSATAIRPGSAFIMMWITEDKPGLTDVSNTVKECFAKFGISAVRADDIEHEDVITQRITDEIKTAEFLFADLTGERPSVYYEVGYAHALGRRVVLFREKGTGLHFDLAGYNCPEYANMTELREKMMARLVSLTGKLPN